MKLKLTKVGKSQTEADIVIDIEFGNKYVGTYRAELYDKTWKLFNRNEKRYVLESEVFSEVLKFVEVI